MQTPQTSVSDLFDPGCCCLANTELFSADTSKRKNTNFFDLLIEQNRVISVWAGTSHPGNDKIKEHILQNTTKSVATVPEGSGEVHYSNKDQVEKRLFNNDIVEPYAKLLTIQRSLTGNSTYGPDQGVYDKEEAFTNPDYPGNTLGKSRNAIFAEFNNRIAATLKVVASAAHNLKVFQDGRCCCGRALGQCIED